MRISELSERSGIPIPTIKLYLREGLLFRGKRTARNQAEYSDEHIRRLHLIRALTEVGGLSLTAVRNVLEAIDDDRVPLIDMLGVAHFALGPTPDRDKPSADLIKALADVDGFLADLGWTVDPDAPGRMYVRRGAFLDHVADFDPDFFGIAQRERAMRAASYFMKIMRATRHGAPLDAAAVREEALVCGAWLRDELQRPKGAWDATVVITHFAPSLRSRTS